MVDRLSIKPSQRLRQASWTLFTYLGCTYLECLIHGVWDYRKVHCKLPARKTRRSLGPNMSSSTTTGYTYRVARIASVNMRVCELLLVVASLVWYIRSPKEGKWSKTRDDPVRARPIKRLRATDALWRVEQIPQLRHRPNDTLGPMRVDSYDSPDAQHFVERGPDCEMRKQAVSNDVALLAACRGGMSKEYVA